MSNDRDDAQGRHETTPFGQQPDTPASRPGASAEPATGSTAWGQQPAADQQPGQLPYGQQYGQQYGQSPYGQQYGQPAQGQQYGQGQPYDQGQQYGQAQQYGQGQQYGQPAAYGQQYAQPEAYGQYGLQYGPGGVAAPARPGVVVTAAVLGFVLGALGVLTTLVLIVFGAAVAGGAESFDEDLFPGAGAGLGAAAGVVLAFGLLALAWTVVMIWGSVWALTGRNRVMLIVAGSIAIAVTGLMLVSALGDGDAGGILFSLLLFAASVATVVLPCLSPAVRYFEAQRARRAQPR